MFSFTYYLLFDPRDITFTYYDKFICIPCVPEVDKEFQFEKRLCGLSPQNHLFRPLATNILISEFDLFKLIAHTLCKPYYTSKKISTIPMYGNIEGPKQMLFYYPLLQIYDVLVSNSALSSTHQLPVRIEQKLQISWKRWLCPGPSWYSSNEDLDD